MDESIVLLSNAITIILLLVMMIMLVKINRQIKDMNGGVPQVSEKVIPKIAQPIVVSSLPPLPPAPPTEPQPENAPDPEPEPVFKCKKCGKEMPDKKKLQRHIGMSHYMDLDI